MRMTFTTVNTPAGKIEVCPEIRNGQPDAFPLGTVRVRTLTSIMDYDNEYNPIQVREASYLTVDGVNDIGLDFFLGPDNKVISHTDDRDFVYAWEMTGSGAHKYLKGNLLAATLKVVVDGVNTVRTPEFYDHCKAAVVMEKHLCAYKDYLDAQRKLDKLSATLKDLDVQGIELGISTHMSRQKELIQDAYNR
jgi:hypothetical protein